ncbi:MAG: DUF1592 domain-containing protein [Alphaproteobacteria bacterium]|nr:DUF1592 domain-containing protein [Alphaproteobacteria bacterium]
MRCWSLMLVLAGCPGPEEPAVRGEAPTVDAAAPVLRRLTDSQYRNAVASLFGPGIVLPANLEPDVPVDELRALGAAVTTISPYGVEQYETAAYQIAEQALSDPGWVAAHVPCTPTAIRDDACARTALEPLGLAVLRRPLEVEELDGLVALAGTAAEALGSFEEGLEYPLARLLQSPAFLYRVEVGENGRYSGYELASRLSFFLWDDVPDAELYAAAAAGELATDAGLAVQVDRMLADPRARAGVRNLFTDLFRLYRLDQIAKDPAVFNAYGPELKASAREETLRVIEYQVFDRDAPYRDLFTSRLTFLDRGLAALYGVRAPAREGFGGVELPVSLGRAGLLGHASILMMEAHPVSTSVTRRGVFVRTALLCHEIPPPPADVDTSIPEPSPDAPTMRERVAVHLEEPTCAGCHRLTDPIGLGLENFDGIGAWRDLENGAAIDPSGELEGRAFDTPSGLAQVIATHPDLAQCLVRRAVASAVGRAPESDDAMLAWHAEGFAESDQRVLWLLRDIVTSPAFARVGEVE